MAEKQSARPGPRGTQTRRQAQRVALRLFTEQGYEATSLRQIADEVGINKASLYYYFDGKEAIVQSLLDERGDEAEALLAWVREQPPSPDLLGAAVLRWVDTFTEDKLQGIRFLAANPLLLASLTPTDEAPRVGAALTRLADELGTLQPARTPESVVLLRMALLSINAAVQAGAGAGVPDGAVVAAARQAARALVVELAPSAGER
ncbi:TetR/AcrR family transcriptional regulator [Microlunatus flavus]|uniref:DNA-binding transcriptional regulator, AcrR family n=1 Tax=Microlunatus flavus TaxID=1036181 RepID=A0A1H9FRH4_9ACTN|nr:TetR/AcrR family transcriptional regulator [Microlunatus flavus]SEQ40512.1 DNA-binding transcriptional regulator, AcrR family [Microlunatus flavus]